MEPVDRLTSFMRALKFNKQMRTVLEDEVTKLRHLLAANQRKQEIVEQALIEDQRSSKSKKKEPRANISVFAAPYFRDLKNMIPPPNEDTITKRRNHDSNVYLVPPRPWTPEECEKLLKSVTAYALSSALQPLQRERDRIKRKIENTCVTEEQLDELNDYLYIAEQKIRLVNRKPLHELMEQLNGKIAWLTVSSANMGGIRTAEECEVMWNNFLSFDVNKGAFDKSEDMKLINLAEDYEERNWDEIAAALKTNRTAFQCFERYQTKWRSRLKIKYWTKEEDDHLLKLIDEHKSEKTIPWTKISSLMEERTHQQVWQRYSYISLRSNYAPWSPEEDALLIALYQKYGPKWHKMKNYFKRRHRIELRERYCNSLLPNLKMGRWSREEDKLFISLIKKYGYGQWTRISRHIPGRTDSQCFHRAGCLLRWSVNYHSERGTGEYDPGVYDPELFAKILRPHPRSDYPPLKGDNFNPLRKKGLERLVKALEIVLPEYIDKIQDINSVDLSWLSSESLVRLSDVLQAELPVTEMREKENPVHLPMYITKPPALRKREEAPESEEEEYLLRSPPVEKQICESERDSVDSTLDVMLKMQADIVLPSHFKASDFTESQWAEMSLYKAYLYQQFQCKALCVNLENVVFDGVDYRETVQVVVSRFVQPPVYRNQFIVLAPNLTTMTGMETVEATEDRLHGMARCLRHSTPYVEYLCEKRRASPPCLRCRSDKRNGRAATPESVMSDMKRKSFLLDERLESAAYVEGASTSRLSSESCVCKDLSDSLSSVRLLRKRFLSLFLWPALMSSVGFSKEQEQVAFTERTEYGGQNYFLNLSTCPMEFQGTGSKRKRRTVFGKKKKLKKQHSLK